MTSKAGCTESRGKRSDESEVWPWAEDPAGKCDPKPWAGAEPLPAQVKGVIAFGYPVFHAKYNRIKPLLQLPADTNLMYFFRFFFLVFIWV